jgi:hypothetical protein
MDPVGDYYSFIRHITSKFKYRYGVDISDELRMVGIVFARPTSQLAKAEIIPQIPDWHYRSGNHIDFYFAGYITLFLSGYSTTPPHFVSVPVPGRGDWLYNSELFNKFRQEIEAKTTWLYSGACDLLLTNARFDAAKDTAVLDFTSTIACQLDSMKDDKAIPIVERFFESIFRFAENATGRDPTWGFSDRQGLALAGSALKRVALSFLPKSLEADVKKAEYFAIRDVAKAGA